MYRSFLTQIRGLPLSSTYKTTPPVRAETDVAKKESNACNLIRYEFLRPCNYRIRFPLRFPSGGRARRRYMQTSRSKTRKSCQRNTRSVRGSPTATIQRLPAYSVHEFRFSLSGESPSYPLSIALYKRGRLSSCDFLPGFDQTRQKAPRLTFRSPSACAISIAAIASAWLRRNVFQV